MKNITCVNELMNEWMNMHVSENCRTKFTWRWKPRPTTQFSLTIKDLRFRSVLGFPSRSCKAKSPDSNSSIVHGRLATTNSKLFKTGPAGNWVRSSARTNTLDTGFSMRSGRKFRVRDFWYRRRRRTKKVEVRLEREEGNEGTETNGGRFVFSCCLAWLG